MSETRTYDNRLRLGSIAAGSLYTLNTPASPISYAPNSDILSANDSVNGSWAYSYDDFNRLAGSNKNSGAEIYGYDYDRFGNRWHQNGPHLSSLGFDANNRIVSGSGVTYDVAGNVTSDGTHSYTYNAENRITQVDGTPGNCTSTSATCYVYNANGERVAKLGATRVDYLYDLAGHEITEIASASAWNRNEIYAGGRHLAIYNGGPSGSTYFVHSDWLGTERARSTATGGPYETCTSLPFGDWLTCSGADPSPMHFTSKERDSESGLDNFGARYNASTMGRFMSPDAFFKDSHVGDPQSWNKYAYVRNNPLRYTDPSGETATVRTECWKISQNNSTICNVSISASIAIYAAPGSGLTQNQLNDAASTIQSSIQNAWSVPSSKMG